MDNRVKVASRVLLLVCILAAFAVPCRSSDHADPIFLSDPDANITGLFFFPHGDQMILILNVRRALTAPKPYPLKGIEYTVFMDLHSKVTFDSDEDRTRYGGTIPNPEGISPDVAIRLHLNDDATLSSETVTGLRSTQGIRYWSGVRDDPFIFPRFFKKNVISMVMSIPMSAFPPGQQDFILWGVTSKNGKQIDHVGRSNRSQLGRFDFLNTLPPNQHVKAIMETMKSRQRIFNWLRKYKLTTPLANGGSMLLGIRKYDFAPDVMIYSNRFPPGFPNGRQLPDDIVAATCATGDCDLQELSFTEGNWPRATKNDKPFSSDFPFLGAPWPDAPEMPGPVSFWHVGIWLLLIFVLVVAFWSWIFYRLGVRACMRRMRTAA